MTDFNTKVEIVREEIEEEIEEETDLKGETLSSTEKAGIIEARVRSNFSGKERALAKELVEDGLEN